MQVKRNPWTPDQITLLSKLYPHERTVDIVEAVGHPVDSIYPKVAKLGIRKSEAFMKSERSGHFMKGRQSSPLSQFQKGGIPWNKGMKGLQTGGEETQFKKGNIPRNHKPIGTVVIRTDGYNRTKTAEPNIWELTHRLAWRLAGNDLPVHPAVLSFKDRNPLNCNIENLELSSKIKMMAANSVQALPTNLRRVIQLHGVLLRKLNGK